MAHHVPVTLIEGQGPGLYRTGLPAVGEIGHPLLGDGPKKIGQRGMDRDRGQLGVGSLPYPAAQLPQRLRSRNPVEADRSGRPVQGGQLIDLEVHLRQGVVLLADAVPQGLSLLTGHRSGKNWDLGVGQLVHVPMKGPLGGCAVFRIASRVGPPGNAHPLVNFFNGEIARGVDQRGNESQQALQSDLLRLSPGHHRDSISFSTRSSWARNGSLHRTVRWAWSFNFKCTQSTV